MLIILQFFFLKSRETKKKIFFNHPLLDESSLAYLLGTGASFPWAYLHLRLPFEKQCFTSLVNKHFILLRKIKLSNREGKLILPVSYRWTVGNFILLCITAFTLHRPLWWVLFPHVSRQCNYGWNLEKSSYRIIDMENVFAIIQCGKTKPAEAVWL